MLIHNAARLAVISFLLFFQCVPSSFAAPSTGSTSSSQASFLQTTDGQVGQAKPAVQTYDQLLAAIRGAKAESRVRVEKAVEQERVREAWEIGKLIDAHVLQHKERADYGKQVIVKLAKDLGMSDTELKYMLQFARTYPIRPAPDELSWAHYRELLSVNDPKEREAVASEAVKNKWSQKKTREAVRKAKIKSGEKISEKPPELLSASKPGIPHTYRVVSGVEAGERVLDLGFSNYYTPPGKFPFKEGDIVTFAQDAKGSYSLTPYSVPRTPYDPLYTYEIKVLEVIDGDTIKAVVDLGFGFRTVQTLRLRGIDAPEITTADGMEAKKALEKMLKMPGNGKRETQTKAGAQ
ncbi:MAG: DUF1016 N-terminal domain-containing protein, partial [Candidatus Omnitrophota bacterium]